MDVVVAVAISLLLSVSFSDSNLTLLGIVVELVDFYRDYTVATIL